MEGGSSGRWYPSLKGNAAVCQSSHCPTGWSWGQEKVDHITELRWRPIKHQWKLNLSANSWPQTCQQTSRLVWLLSFLIYPRNKSHQCISPPKDASETIFFGRVAVTMPLWERRNMNEWIHTFFCTFSKWMHLQFLAFLHLGFKQSSIEFLHPLFAGLFFFASRTKADTLPRSVNGLFSTWKIPTQRHHKKQHQSKTCRLFFINIIEDKPQARMLPVVKSFKWLLKLF